jgi:hypothetical protein
MACPGDCDSMVRRGQAGTADGGRTSYLSFPAGRLKPKIWLIRIYRGRCQTGGPPCSPSKAQQHAIEARLNFALGAETYDRLFLGFVCGGVKNEIADVFVQNEDTAAIVGTEYSWHVAVVVESVLKEPVKRVNVWPRNLSPTR